MWFSSPLFYLTYYWGQKHFTTEQDAAPDLDFLKKKQKNNTNLEVDMQF